jgi:hypothetical protein
VDASYLVGLVVYVLIPASSVSAGIYLGFSGRPSPVRRVLGLIVVALGPLYVWLLFRWLNEYCYETDQPCDGEVLNWAPWIILLLTIGAVVATIIFGLSRRRR